MNDLAVHPSGKLALSVGRDRSLRIWNLMSGRCAYITMRPVGKNAAWSVRATCPPATVFPRQSNLGLFFALHTEPTQVGWLPSGDGYYIGAGTGVHVYSTATSEIVASCTLPDRVMRVRAISVSWCWRGAIFMRSERKMLALNGLSSLEWLN